MKLDNLTDIVLAVERGMTDDERSLVLSRWAKANPHYVGAHVADILDLLSDHDANLAQTEPWWDDHGDKVPDAEKRLWGIAVIAAVWTDPASAPRIPSYDTVADFVERAKAASG